MLAAFDSQVLKGSRITQVKLRDTSKPNNKKFEF